MMDKMRLFTFLKTQDSANLINLLDTAYDTMNTNQRHEVFGKLNIDVDITEIDETDLLKKIKIFYDESLKGVYYAPFDINSKNYMNIPEETEEWFDKLADLLLDASRVCTKGCHQVAVECCNILYNLIEEMQQGKEIIFAHEYGTWMIPLDEKPVIKAYLYSLSIVATPEEFTASVIPLLERDSHESFSNQVYRSAVQVASKDQKKLLESIIKKQKVLVK